MRERKKTFSCTNAENYGDKTTINRNRRKWKQNTRRNSLDFLSSNAQRQRRLFEEWVGGPCSTSSSFIQSSFESSLWTVKHRWEKKSQRRKIQETRKRCEIGWMFICMYKIDKTPKKKKRNATLVLFVRSVVFSLRIDDEKEQHR